MDALSIFHLDLFTPPRHLSATVLPSQLIGTRNLYHGIQPGMAVPRSLMVVYSANQSINQSIWSVITKFMVLIILITRAATLDIRLGRRRQNSGRKRRCYTERVTINDCLIFGTAVPAEFGKRTFIQHARVSFTDVLLRLTGAEVCDDAGELLRVLQN